MSKTLIAPQNVLVAIPCHDGRNMAELTGSLVMGARHYCAISMNSECSHPSLVRNQMADTFLRSKAEWLVHIDSDIYPSPEDWEHLLECTDPAMTYVNPDGSSTRGSFEAQTIEQWGKDAPPVPTRIDTLTRSGTRTMADVLVCAEYAYKQEPFRPVKLGAGFVRVHRSVFEVLQNLKHGPGETVEVSRELIEKVRQARDDRMAAVKDPDGDVHAAVSTHDKLVQQLLDSVRDKTGAPRLWQCTHNGRTFWDYYPSGPVINEFVPTTQWMGEDHGFFTLCMLAGIVVRIERRTRLTHLGRKGYPYLSPEEVARDRGMLEALGDAREELRP